MKACRKAPLQIHFLYLDNKEIYFIFETRYIMSVLFSTNVIHFIILFFLFK
jgi:hypothetical protein